MQRRGIIPVLTEQDVRDFFAQQLAVGPHCHSAENLVALAVDRLGVGDGPNGGAFLAVVDAIARSLAPSEEGIWEELERGRAERYTAEQVDALIMRQVAAYAEANWGEAPRWVEVDGVIHVPPCVTDWPEPGPTYIDLMEARWAAFERR
jgi:hypothetical protein